MKTMYVSVFETLVASYRPGDTVEIQDVICLGFAELALSCVS
jgi:hypothetical protein